MTCRGVWGLRDRFYGGWVLQRPNLALLDLARRLAIERTRLKMENRALRRELAKR